MKNKHTTGTYWCRMIRKNCDAFHEVSKADNLQVCFFFFFPVEFMKRARNKVDRSRKVYVPYNLIVSNNLYFEINLL